MHLNGASSRYLSTFVLISVATFYNRPENRHSTKSRISEPRPENRGISNLPILRRTTLQPFTGRCHNSNLRSDRRLVTDCLRFM